MGISSSRFGLSKKIYNAISTSHPHAIASDVFLFQNGPIYQFKYQVHNAKTNDYKTHEEFGEDGLVHGTYTVREPTGDLRIVSYTAGDEKGFQVSFILNAFRL